VKIGKKDIAYSITKAGLSSIPIIGAAASELFQFIVTPPIEKRRNQWINEIGEKLKLLEEKHKIDFSDLSKNDVFIDVVIQTTQNAIKTSEKEKLILYRNVLINTAIGEAPEQSEIHIFINLLADFTTWHIRILKFFDYPKDWFDKNKVQTPKYQYASLSGILYSAFPELKDKEDFCNLIWNDLYRVGFHRSGSFNGMMTGSSLFNSITTAFGKRFLDFINEYEPY